MTTPEYGVFIDWANDGDFTDPGDDVTERVKARSPITIQYGRDQARSLAPIQPGRAEVELDNTSQDYSPENTSSPLAGGVKPGRPVLMKATLDGVEHVLYQGFLDGFDPMPDIEDRSVALSALDALARFREVKLSTELHHSIQTGDAIHKILDAMGWPASKRDIDQGATTIRWWWEEGTDAFDALTSVVDSEGPGSLVTVGTDGNFVFRSRHARLTDAASLTSQATFSAADCAEPVMAPPLGYDVGWREIINSVSISVEERVPTPVPVVVFETEQPYVVPEATEVTLIAEASNPFLNAITPVRGQDYVLQSGSVAVSLSRTSGESTTIRLRATGSGPAVIVGMKLRAHSLEVAANVQVAQEDAESIKDFGVRSYPGDPHWVGVHDALAIAQLVLAHRSQSRPVVTVRLKGVHPARLEQQLTRDLSDRVTVIDPSISLDADFYIEQIQHSIAGPEGYFETVFGCEMVPRGDIQAFQFNVAGRGFNQGAFQGDSAATIFRLNTSGQGLNQGRLAT